MALFLGLDLGQSQDYTALAVLERVPPPLIEVREGLYGIKRVPSKEPPALHVRHLERFPLGTRYPTIVQEVGNRLHALTTGKERPTLVVDKTGVGAPVVDMFAAAKLDPIAITITAGGEPQGGHGGGGSAGSPGYAGWTVPKRDLVGVVQTTLQTKRLRFADGLPGLEILTKELLNFQYKITAHANDIYGAWREGTNDDTVLAVALAVFYADRMYHPPVTKEDLMPLSLGQPV
jgi:hypothetical protein